MAKSGGPGTFLKAVAGIGLLLPFLCTPALAGTAGRISGRVVDAKKQPLTGVNVQVPAARTGAITDADGRYVVVNVPAGTYDVRLSLVGYRATTVTGLVVSADDVTKLDGVLELAPVEMKEVVVSARRPVVDLARTSTLASVNRQQIQNLPVQELDQVVNLQAGVVDGHFRGGRKGEVQFQVDGVTVNNVYDNTSTLKLDTSLLEEVQVVSGTFDAEYGQAMSGVVNAVLRRGSDRFRWDAEVMGGAFAFGGGTRRLQSSNARLGALNAQVSASGPTFVPKTTYLANVRAHRLDDWIEGRRVFEPTDRNDFENGVAHPTGDGERVPLAYTHEWSGLTKLTNRSFTGLELNYQAVFNGIEGRRADWAWRLNPDGITKQRTWSVTHGLDVTHTLGTKTYWTLSVRQNYFDYRDRLYDDLYDPRYLAAGLPVGTPAYEDGAILQGAQYTRFRQQTNALVTKASFVKQYRRDQQLKAGAEWQWPVMRFGALGYIVARTDSTTGRTELQRFESEPPTFPGVVEFRPRLGAAFVQNDGEWNDLRVRGGVRFEVFQPNATLPSNLFNPANVIPPPAPQSVPVAATTKTSLAPRVGVSYPVTRDASLFFAYGHFYQLPALGTAFNDADYRVLSTLIAGTNNFRVLGNPDIRPERTVQYQFGYKQAVTPRLGLEVSTFYKDVRDLLGVELLTTYNDAEYARLTNVDFGNVLGSTVTLTWRGEGALGGTLDYTWQVAQGNSSDPKETATRAAAQQDPRPRTVPFTWDQRHTLNLTAILSRPDSYTSSAILRLASGQPYTPTVSNNFGGGLGTNSGRKPAVMSLDLLNERHVVLRGVRTAAFLRVYNVLDTRFFNGFVFGSTGSPYYSFDVVTDRDRLGDPTRYYGPRRLEVGITLRGGAEQ